MIKKFNTYEIVEFIETRLPFYVRLQSREYEEQSEWCRENAGIMAPYTCVISGFTMDTTAEFDWCIVYSDEHGYRMLFKNGSDAVLFKLRFG